MKERPLRTTVTGSHPFPGWLELASAHLDRFGPDDVRASRVTTETKIAAARGIAGVIAEDE